MKGKEEREGDTGQNSDDQWLRNDELRVVRGDKLGERRGEISTRVRIDGSSRVCEEEGTGGCESGLSICME